MFELAYENKNRSGLIYRLWRARQRLWAGYLDTFLSSFFLVVHDPMATSGSEGNNLTSSCLAEVSGEIACHSNF